MTKTSLIERNNNTIHVIIDATDIPVGRLSTKVVNIIRGKNKTIYSPHLDNGENVIIINASKVLLTGDKINKKEYKSYSGYRGGLKIKKAHEIFKKNPEMIISHAIWGMIPHNRLGRKLFKKVKIYPYNEHPHKAQNPRNIN